MVDAAVERFGGLHVAFNNAGTIGKGTFAEITEESASKMIDVNFKSLVFCFKYQVHCLLSICRLHTRYSDSATGCVLVASGPHDVGRAPAACYDRSSTFWGKQFLNDDVPQPKIIGMSFLFRKMVVW